MKIEYNLHEISKNIFALEIPDGYDRAMLFLRCQEYYESHFPEFRNTHFDFFHYMDHYRKWKGLEFFSYPDDWAGFNVPGEIVEEVTNYALNNETFKPTPYDYIMEEVIDQIKQRIEANSKWYLIGVDKLDGRTIQHEIAHALFYINIDYRKTMLSLVIGMERKVFDKIEDLLYNMGYDKSVILDEIQAYMSTGLMPSMGKIRGIKKYTIAFKRRFKEFNPL